ncbi:TATA box-binding protein-associated factor RNA polymerase I subunit B isoform X1 [Sesamum indicum]|uniref:TATA box-binding protein-associated factor RNA polymerase I subunit B isoform X1 n=2 Tax=Sesamum indicum TaxID=4182 RepID=A0A6I9T2H7_SESIN|nr:TATA box-binding protein-associated factor RNA polymerase I subunit B isoform X1 [Sesamum indicum]XP_011077140.1 TATA box-binding protein-associated factor RNA polymerase I subunit B isoform X1 [Sesamum indicum]
MVGRVERICQVCGSSVGFTRSDDGFFYCGYCNSQADDIFDTGVDEEQFFSHYSANCNRVRPANAIAAEPISQVKLTTSQYLDHPDILVDDMEDDGMGDGVGPSGPSDFGSSQKNFSYEDYYSEIRSRYLTGLQVMIQLQCQALVEKFNVSPLIIGLVGTLWLRFLASTRIMADEWADQAVNDSEAQTQGETEEFKPSAKFRSEPVNIHGKRVVYVWYRSLRSKIPISCSLAISFLVCHVAREGVTPLDMLKWTLEGKLPYFAAFGEIEKQLGSHSEACPIRASRMFRPIQAISSQKLEAMAADIAQKIGLELPPVNFYAIAFRYCRQLSLPVREILPQACRVCEWSMPSELYLSANEFRIPTRVCVMSILIVAIRILFDINGYGMWEFSLSNSSCSLSQVKNTETESQSFINTMEKADEDSSSNNSQSSGAKSEVADSKLSVVELLQILEEKYNELNDVHAYSSDLPSYLQYCKDVVFSGLWPSYEDLEEEKLLEEFWDFYQKHKGSGTSDHQGDAHQSRPDEVEKTRSIDQNSASCTQSPEESPKDKAIRQLKLDMEENKFCYIPPRIKVKRKDYLHYARRRKDVYIYAVHADYYILLRACAKAAQVEPRVMHIAVLGLERRLRWLENRMDASLKVKLNLNGVCDFCKDEFVQNGGSDPMDLKT